MSQQTLSLIDQLVSSKHDQIGELGDGLKKAAVFRNKDIISETLLENERIGHYVRIYPAKNSNMYDQFFSGPRPLNKLVYKMLFSNEVLP